MSSQLLGRGDAGLGTPSLVWYKWLLLLFDSCGPHMRCLFHAGKEEMHMEVGKMASHASLMVEVKDSSNLR